MADPDAEARLLDGIVGKYGDDSDYGDLGNADEDALLEGYDDPDCGDIKHSTRYHDDMEELDHEPEEPEDVLDLEAQDVELEEDEGDRTNLNATAVSSTTQPEIDISLHNQSELEEYERNTDKFKNERQNPPSKTHSIPDSLDEVPVTAPVRNNQNRNGPRMGGGQMRGRGGRGGMNNRMQQKNRPDNKTVLINPHFKGQVHINNDARLTWDARHRINQNKNQIGKVFPFSQKPNQTVTTVHPWINSSNNNLAQNVPQFQPPPQQAYPNVYQSPPPPPVSPWNPPQYSPNPFNQVPPQMSVNNNNQSVFMHPLPNQNIFNNSMPQFNQPPPHYTPPSPSFQNQPIFNNTQFPPPPPPNQSLYQNFPQNSVYHQQQSNNNQYIPPPQNLQQEYNNQPINTRFVQQPNRNLQRFSRPKPNFNQGKGGQYQNYNQKMSPNKRKVDNNVDMRRKRKQSSTNLHEVPTVETPDTTVKEEKVYEEEDEETRMYRLKIEEQKKLRKQLVEEKEERRRQKLQEEANPSTVQQPIMHWQEKQPPKPLPQLNLQTIRTNQTIRPISESYPSTSNNRPQFTRVFANQQTQNRTIKVINTTDNDEANYDKQHLASFLSNRKILTKDQSLADTTLVVVSNLAAGTTDVKLRKMCHGIGDIKKLQMSPKERQATIQFNSVASAHAFFKKYQRTMLDLSMIQVTLKPMP